MVVDCGGWRWMEVDGGGRWWMEVDGGGETLWRSVATTRSGTLVWTFSIDWGSSNGVH